MVTGDGRGMELNAVHSRNGHAADNIIGSWNLIEMHDAGTCTHTHTHLGKPHTLIEISTNIPHSLPSTLDRKEVRNPRYEGEHEFSS